MEACPSDGSDKHFDLEPLQPLLGVLGALATRINMVNAPRERAGEHRFPQFLPRRRH